MIKWMKGKIEEYNDWMNASVHSENAVVKAFVALNLVALAVLYVSAFVAIVAALCFLLGGWGFVLAVAILIAAIFLADERYETR